MIRFSTKLRILGTITFLSFCAGFVISVYGSFLKKHWHQNRRKRALQKELTQIEADRKRIEGELREMEE